mmetsp:Transcript_108011/g.161589  ORF Transcript_108011/g.161589 Transcript_108011/m.161589 type:complete len:542 (-) Transcript_108011:1081-2706(-)
MEVSGSETIFAGGFGSAITGVAAATREDSGFRDGRRLEGARLLDIIGLSLVRCSNFGGGPEGTSASNEIESGSRNSFFLETPAAPGKRRFTFKFKFCCNMEILDPDFAVDFGTTFSGGGAFNAGGSSSSNSSLLSITGNRRSPESKGGLFEVFGFEDSNKKSSNVEVFGGCFFSSSFFAGVPKKSSSTGNGFSGSFLLGVPKKSSSTEGDGFSTDDRSGSGSFFGVTPKKSSSTEDVSFFGSESFSVFGAGAKKSSSGSLFFCSVWSAGRPKKSSSTETGAGEASFFSSLALIALTAFGVDDREPKSSPSSSPNKESPAKELTDAVEEATFLEVLFVVVFFDLLRPNPPKRSSSSSSNSEILLLDPVAAATFLEEASEGVDVFFGVEERLKNESSSPSSNNEPEEATEVSFLVSFFATGLVVFLESGLAEEPNNEVSSLLNNPSEAGDSAVGSSSNKNERSALSDAPLSCTPERPDNKSVGRTCCPNFGFLELGSSGSGSFLPTPRKSSSSSKRPPLSGSSSAGGRGGSPPSSSISPPRSN